MNAPLRVIVIVAHPDEAEEYAAGTIALLARAGHYVKIVSMTNGDAGHLELGPKPLARRRAHEAFEAARVLNVANYEILEHHDGELVTSTKARRQIIRAIRRWQADIVLTFHDECDGHRDNRTAARIVRDAVDLVTLPNICAETPALTDTPICFRMVDFGAIEHHEHHVVVDIGDTLETKLHACAAHATQFFEFAPAERGLHAPVGRGWDEQRAFILEHWGEYFYASPDMQRALEAAYGPGRGDGVEYAESFELASYGRQVSADEARDLIARATRPELASIELGL